MSHHSSSSTSSDTGSSSSSSSSEGKGGKDKKGKKGKKDECAKKCCHEKPVSYVRQMNNPLVFEANRQALCLGTGYRCFMCQMDDMQALVHEPVSNRLFCGKTTCRGRYNALREGAAYTSDGLPLGVCHKCEAAGTAAASGNQPKRDKSANYRGRTKRTNRDEAVYYGGGDSGSDEY